MRLTVAAVGRLRGGPEAELVADYLERTTATGRPGGIGPAGLVEIDERKAATRAAQSAGLLASVQAAAVCVALDERGRALPSRDFAATLARWRDAGRPEATFLIGGADGHTPEIRDRADFVLSFGPMVWPHRLVRVMLAEQLFRAVSILAKTQYHRD
ncbi:MAG: 23S rRNA (pseudouridine(1915)-N(3))-methyltransferase RlmH [Paracoccaceae bacterium]